jgi:hypothetical protein
MNSSFTAYNPHDGKNQIRSALQNITTVQVNLDGVMTMYYTDELLCERWSDDVGLIFDTRLAILDNIRLFVDMLNASPTLKCVNICYKTNAA